MRGPLKFLGAPTGAVRQVSNLRDCWPGQFGARGGQPPHGEHLCTTARLLAEISEPISWLATADFLDFTIRWHRQQLAYSKTSDHEDGYCRNPQSVPGFGCEFPVDVSKTQQSRFGRQTIAPLLLARNRVAVEILDPWRLRSVVKRTGDSTGGQELREGDYR